MQYKQRHGRQFFVVYLRFSISHCQVKVFMRRHLSLFSPRIFFKQINMQISKNVLKNLGQFPGLLPHQEFWGPGGSLLWCFLDDTMQSSYFILTFLPDSLCQELLFQMLPGLAHTGSFHGLPRENHLLCWLGALPFQSTYYFGVGMCRAMREG